MARPFFKRTRSEQSLYVTLIDFLMQLLFFGLLIGVMYAIANAGEDDAMVAVTKERDKLAIQLKDLYQATGTTDFPHLKAELGRLGPLSEVSKLTDVARALAPSVEAVGGLKNAQRLIEDQVRRGQFKPPCFDNPAKVATFHAHADHIMADSQRGAEFRRLINELKVDEARLNRMSFEQFSEIFSEVLVKFPDCRFNVTVVEYTPLKQPRDVVRRFFYAFPVEAGRR